MACAIKSDAGIRDCAVRAKPHRAELAQHLKLRSADLEQRSATAREDLAVAALRRRTEQNAAGVEHRNARRPIAVGAIASVAEGVKHRLLRGLAVGNDPVHRSAAAITAACCTVAASQRDAIRLPVPSMANPLCGWAPSAQFARPQKL